MNLIGNNMDPDQSSSKADGSNTVLFSKEGTTLVYQVKAPT